MTVNEAIDRTDSLYSNGFEYGEKVKWLSQLDGKIYDELISTHDGYCGGAFGGYTEDDGCKELFAKMPYDDIYIKFLAMQFDLVNGETDRYINSASVFSDAYADYSAWYNRSHKPKRTIRKYW